MFDDFVGSGIDDDVCVCVCLCICAFHRVMDMGYMNIGLFKGISMRTFKIHAIGEVLSLAKQKPLTHFIKAKRKWGCVYPLSELSLPIFFLGKTKLRDFPRILRLSTFIPNDLASIHYNYNNRRAIYFEME